MSLNFVPKHLDQCWFIEFLGIKQAVSHYHTWLFTTQYVKRHVQSWDPFQTISIENLNKSDTEPTISWCMTKTCIIWLWSGSPETKYMDEHPRGLWGCAHQWHTQITPVSIPDTCRLGGHFKNVSELLNLRALKISVLDKIIFFNGWVRYFVWNFKGYLWNSTQNILELCWKL